MSPKATHDQIFLILVVWLCHDFWSEIYTLQGFCVWQAALEARDKTNLIMEIPHYLLSLSRKTTTPF